MRLFLLSALASLVFLAPVHAGGLLYRLPEDGTFVRFEMESSSKPKDGEAKSFKGTLTMSSVGEEKVDGKLCRWIEVHAKAGSPGDHVVKVLIPVEHLKAGESPLDHAVRGWRKMSDGVTAEIINFKSNDAAILLMLLPGPLDGAKDVPKKVIDCKLGKLECTGGTGTHTCEPHKDFTSEVTYETWLHDTAPFGVVSSRMSAKTIHNGEHSGEFTMTVRVLEVGKGAKSELTEQ